MGRAGVRSCSSWQCVCRRSCPLGQLRRADCSTKSPNWKARLNASMLSGSGYVYNSSNSSKWQLATETTDRFGNASSEYLVDWFWPADGSYLSQRANDCFERRPRSGLVRVTWESQIYGAILKSAEGNSTHRPRAATDALSTKIRPTLEASALELPGQPDRRRKSLRLSNEDCDWSPLRDSKLFTSSFLNESERLVRNHIDTPGGCAQGIKIPRSRSMRHWVVPRVSACQTKPQYA